MTWFMAHRGMGRLTIGGAQIMLWHEEYLSLVLSLREQQQGLLVQAALDEVEAMFTLRFTDPDLQRGP